MISTMALESLVDTILETCEEGFVTIDTEFARSDYYWPKLCLIQLAWGEGPDQTAIIDPMAENLDLTPLKRLMEAPSIVKVLHAARQDLEIFYNLFGTVPFPLFDTQVAAMVCGFGEAASYETLVKSIVKKPLDKGVQFTNWEKRPLSERQLKYALEDVTFLRPVYRNLRDRLIETDRASWIESEMAKFQDLSLYAPDPLQVWKRLRYRSQKPAFLGILRAMAAARELFAQRANTPRQRLLKDEVMLEMAAELPQNMKTLSDIRQVSGAFLHSDLAKEMLHIMAHTDQYPLPEGELPKPAGVVVSPALMELLRLLLKYKAERHEVCERLIASTDDLMTLIAGESDDHPLKSGWRRDIFGEDAQGMLEGRIVLGASKRSVRVMKWKETAST